MGNSTHWLDRLWNRRWRQSSCPWAYTKRSWTCRWEISDVSLGNWLGFLDGSIGWMEVPHMHQLFVHFSDSGSWSIGLLDGCVVPPLIRLNVVPWTQIARSNFTFKCVIIQVQQYQRSYCSISRILDSHRFLSPLMVCWKSSFSDFRRSYVSRKLVSFSDRLHVVKATLTSLNLKDML